MPARPTWSPPTSHPRGPGARIALALVALMAVLLVAACGSSSKTTSSSSSSTPTSTPTASTSTPAASSGGSSKSLTLGTKNFTEEYIVGELYRQELQAHGYTVNYKESIGATEVVDKALTSGQIDAYPEYTGESVATVAGINQTVSSPQQEYQLAQAFYAKRGQAMSQMTPFFDTDAIAVNKSFAQKYNLKTTADLKKVPHFTLGARPEFLNREEGAKGMRDVYGVNNFTFKSLALGVTYQALDNNSVDAIDVFTTDPQLASGKYVVLTDPKNIFGFQNLALVINKSKLAQLGGSQFMDYINKVNALLTTPAMVALNKAVAIDKESAATVAHAFLTANHLL